MRNIKLAVLQMRGNESQDKNVERAVARIEAAADEGVHVVCLQELFTGPYPCQSEDHRIFSWAETIPGPTSETLSELARRREIVIVAPLFERRAPGLYHNSAAVIDADGSIAGVYRKMHIPDDPLFYEKFYFTPGDLGFKSFRTKHAKIGVLICWDQWYPEAARLTALAGAEILFYPTAIGWHPAEKAEYGLAQHESWETIQRSHAIANGVYVAAPNRIGHEGAADGGIEFWGQSFVCDPSGTVMEKAGADQPEILIAECDLSRLDVQRTHWPFLRDRRIDAYGELVKRYRD
jgi:N-carbamoylputrescine amidase